MFDRKNNFWGKIDFILGCHRGMTWKDSTCYISVTATTEPCEEYAETWLVTGSKSTDSIFTSCTYSCTYSYVHIRMYMYMYIFSNSTKGLTSICVMSCLKAFSVLLLDTLSDLISHLI